MAGSELPIKGIDHVREALRGQPGRLSIVESYVTPEANWHNRFLKIEGLERCAHAGVRLRK